MLCYSFTGILCFSGLAFLRAPFFANPPQVIKTHVFRLQIRVLQRPSGNQTL